MDVVLDLMIHDIDIVLALTGAEPEEIRAAGHLDPLRQGGHRQRAAGVPERLRRQPDRQPRLHRAGPQAAPLPAAPVHFAGLRRQDAVAFTVGEGRQIGFETLAVTHEEPLRREVESFLECVSARSQPLVTGEQALAALEVAAAILGKIEEHTRLVASHLSPQR